jgi:hypothetical protein
VLRTKLPGTGFATFLGMPSLWKILFLSAFCLGLSPSWGLEPLDSDTEEFVASDKVVKLSEEKESAQKVERILNEKEEEATEEVLTETVDDAEKTKTVGNPSKLEPENRVVEQVAPLDNLSNVPKETYQEPFKSVQSPVLDSLGIQRLSKGINIFRYSHYVLKKQPSLAKFPSLPKNTVQ